MSGMINMKCRNCGEKMISLYARNGFIVYVCKKAQLSIVKRNHSQIKDGVIYCNTDIIAEDKMLKDTLILDLAKISKQITQIQKRLIA